MLELQKVLITEIRIIKCSFVRRFSRDLKILFELAKVRNTRVRIKQSLLYITKRCGKNMPI